MEVIQDCCLQQLKSLRKNINPVDIAILPKFPDKDAIVLRPCGSLWIMDFPIRKDGQLIIKENLDGWFLADRITWKTRKDHIPLEGKSNRKFLGSAGYCLRFTKDFPINSWTDPNAIQETDSIWERSSQEDLSWYIRQIAFTCPPKGIVFDPCSNPIIKQATEILNRIYVDVKES